MGPRPYLSEGSAGPAEACPSGGRSGAGWTLATHTRRFERPHRAECALGTPRGGVSRAARGASLLTAPGASPRGPGRLPRRLARWRWPAGAAWVLLTGRIGFLDGLASEATWPLENDLG